MYLGRDRIARGGHEIGGAEGDGGGGEGLEEGLQLFCVYFVGWLVGCVCVYVWLGGWVVGSNG